MRKLFSTALTLALTFVVAEEAARWVVNSGGTFFARHASLDVPSGLPQAAAYDGLADQVGMAPPEGRATNDPYDDFETVALPGATTIEVDGEVAAAVKVNLAQLPIRSIVVKEMALRDGKAVFVGAYRYDGYALDEILDRVVLQKKNQKEFRPTIDAYVEVSNGKGDSALISWCELYLPVHRHEILIAMRATRIVPSESKTQWPLPAETRLVVPSDLLSERNIASPTHLSVRSLDDPFKPDKTGNPAFSPEIAIVKDGQAVAHVKTITSTHEYPTVFYGRGQGNHGVYSMNGALLRQVLQPYVPVTRESLRRGMLTIAGKDAFRAAYTVSEVMNRSDQSEVLLVDNGDGDTGRFRLFPSGDFFSSDRAVHTLVEIRYAILK
jgi:hypothetical protein